MYRGTLPHPISFRASRYPLPKSNHLPCREIDPLLLHVTGCVMRGTYGTPFDEMGRHNKEMRHWNRWIDDIR